MAPRVLPTEEPGRAVTAALEHLAGGGILGIPTETVYGLAGHLRPDVVERIFNLKGRSPQNPLPLQTHSLENVLHLGFSLSAGAMRLARVYWPGSLTLILNRPPFLPGWYAPGEEGIALRVPSHPLCLGILGALEPPLAVTSANITGAPPARTPEELAVILKDADDLLILTSDHRPTGTASAVVDSRGENPVLLRSGTIPMEKIRAVWTER